MNHYIQAHADEEMSTTSDCSTTLDMHVEEQIPSTVEFETHAKPLQSTMGIKTRSQVIITQKLMAQHHPAYIVRKCASYNASG